MSTSPTSFDCIAEAYELLVNEAARWKNERPALEEWLDEAGEGRRRVLDIGCGTGFHARHLTAHLNAEAVGIDPSPRMLEVARNKEFGDRVNWACAAADTPPHGQFDCLLLLGNTLSLIGAPEPIFAALAAVAVPGSLLIIQTLNYEVLRQKGPQRIERTGVRSSIEKRLDPHPTGAASAATLRLKVSDQAGAVLEETTAELIDHSTEALQSFADAAGWSLAETRRSYRDPAAGPDRILVFRFGEQLSRYPQSGGLRTADRS